MAKTKKVVKKTMKVEKKPETCSCSTCCISWWKLLVSELGGYFFIVYFLYLLQIQANYWLGGLILLILLNIAMWTCPSNNTC